MIDDEEISEQLNARQRQMSVGPPPPPAFANMMMGYFEGMTQTQTIGFEEFKVVLPKDRRKAEKVWTTLKEMVDVYFKNNLSE
jgi:hypothetical protein